MVEPGTVADQWLKEVFSKLDVKFCDEAKTPPIALNRHEPKMYTVYIAISDASARSPASYPTSRLNSDASRCTLCTDLVRAG